MVCAVAIVSASQACRPAAKVENARNASLGSDLAGLWAGVRRDEPTGGLYRSTALLLDLRSDPSGAVGGTVEIRGELAAKHGEEGKTVPCSQTPGVAVTGTGTITAGRLTKGGAWFNLAPPQLSDPAACGSSFPQQSRCELRGMPDGSALLSCGTLEIRLRRISLAGTWVLDDERADQSGDMATWRLRLHLRQSANKITGVADHIRLNVSGDEQRFRCNGRRRYDRQARHQLRGQVSGRQVHLDVGDTVQKVGPCQGQLSLPPTLSGTWKPLVDRLVLKVGEDEHSLWRRPPSLGSGGVP